VSRDPSLTQSRPRPVRDEVERPVPVVTAVVALAMFALHLVLDRYADPVQYGIVWGWVQVIVEAGIVAGVTWWRARVAARRAEAQVTPVSDPRIEREGRLVKLVPAVAGGPKRLADPSALPKGDLDERSRRPRRYDRPPPSE
jgi:hypothetical protein